MPGDNDEHGYSCVVAIVQPVLGKTSPVEINAGAAGEGGDDGVEYHGKCAVGCTQIEVERTCPQLSVVYCRSEAGEPCGNESSHPANPRRGDGLWISSDPS